MDDLFASTIVVLAFAIAAVTLSWLYFRRFQITRPPVGVFNLTDIAFMIGCIILVPYLYLLLPLWLVAGLLLLVTLSVLYFMWEPVLRVRLLVWLVTMALAGTDVLAALLLGTADNGFNIVNDLVLLAVVVGLANLWAQSGMRARDIVILGGFLAFYDLAATWLLPLMNEMMLRLAGMPLSPMFAWAIGSSSTRISVGLGDLLLASVIPVVMRKAFGRVAGWAAMIITLGAIAVLMLAPPTETFPVMIVVGPLMIVQYAYWSRRKGRERTTRQYLQAEPVKTM